MRGTSHAISASVLWMERLKACKPLAFHYTVTKSRRGFPTFYFYLSLTFKAPAFKLSAHAHVFISNLSSGLCGHVRFTRLRPVWHCGRTRKYHTSSGLLTSVGGVGRCGQAVCSLCITESCGIMRRKPAGYQNVIFTFIPNQCNHYVLFFKTKNKSPN